MLLFELILIALLVACATVVPGMFLVLRKTALVSDAVSHAVLLGIALMFLLIGELNSGWLLFGAVGSGLLAVAMIEFLMSQRFIRSEAAMGIIFPLFFSVGVMVISKYAHHVHLDTDMVMLGELSFAPLTRFYFGGVDVGPSVVWKLGILLIFQIMVIVLLYKELVLSSWDREYARLIGMRPRLLYFLVVLLTSITAVLSFESVGSIVVVALMITPAATALLVARTMRMYFLLSVLSALFSAVVGIFIGWSLNVSLAGSIAAVAGIVFIGVWLATIVKKGKIA